MIRSPTTCTSSSTIAGLPSGECPLRLKLSKGASCLDGQKRGGPWGSRASSVPWGEQRDGGGESNHARGYSAVSAITRIVYSYQNNKGSLSIAATHTPSSPLLVIDCARSNFCLWGTPCLFDSRRRHN